MKDETRRIVDGAMWTAVAVVILVAAVFIGIDVFGLDAEGKAEQACKEAVEGDLKSPGSAEWVDVQVTGADDSFTVRGKVDSENDFGALLRGSFSCETVDGEVVDHTLSEG